jgi:hypothetical protein
MFRTKTSEKNVAIYFMLNILFSVPLTVLDKNRPSDIYAVCHLVTLEHQHWLPSNAVSVQPYASCRRPIHCLTLFLNEHQKLSITN